MPKVVSPLKALNVLKLGCDMRETPSSISRLPKAVRDEIGALREAGHTLDEILAHLQGLRGVSVSRSALGRWTKKQSGLREAITRSQVMAEAIGRSFGDSKTSRVAQANVDLLHSMLMKFMVIVEGEDSDDNVNKLTSNDFKNLATAAEKLAKASKTDFDQRLKEMLELERRQTVEQAATVGADAARRRGLSAETADMIKREILGMEKK